MQKFRHSLSHAAEVLFENNCFTESCSGSKAGSYLRRIDFLDHTTLCVTVITKTKKGDVEILRKKVISLDEKIFFQKCPIYERFCVIL